MKLNRSARELLDRYLLAVKRELTGKQREDIAAEIESYLLDMLEEHFPETEEVTKPQIEDILQEMGAPRKIAAQYMPQRYLIGPRLFPAYILVLKIVIAAVAGALILSLVITSVIRETSFAWLAILEYFGTIWSGIFSTAGSITIVFAIIERLSESIEIKELDEFHKFKLHDLPELPAEEKEPSKIGTSIEIALSLIGIAFFTYINSTGGCLPHFFNPQTEMELVQVFTNGFLRYVPLILALAGLDLARDVTLLVQGYHSALTNWWQICTQGAHVIMRVFLIQSLPLITLDALRMSGIADIDFTHLESLANTGIAIAIAVGMVITIIDTLRKVIREIHNPSA